MSKRSSISGRRLRNESILGTSHFDANVASAVTLSSVAPRLILRALVTARPSVVSASTAASWMTLPASVSCTVRLVRTNRAMPS